MPYGLADIRDPTHRPRPRSCPAAAGRRSRRSDLLYCSVALTDSSKNIQEAYDTDAYGNTICFSAAGTAGNWFASNATPTTDPRCTFIFTGRRYDPESLIYFYRARYYHPALGRFVSRDPIGYVDAMNSYAYIGSRAPESIDPYGMSWVDWIPIVATIKNIAETPKGSTVLDYTGLEVTKEECDRDAAIAEQNCQRRITARMLEYIADYVPGVAKGIWTDIAGATLASMSARLLAARGASAAATSWIPIAGWVLAGDAVVNVTVTVSNAFTIRDAAVEAKRKMCDCHCLWHPPAPSSRTPGRQGKGTIERATPQRMSDLREISRMPPHLRPPIPSEVPPITSVEDLEIWHRVYVQPSQMPQR